MPEYRFPPQHDIDQDLLEAYGPLIPVAINAPLPRRRYLTAHGDPADPSRAGFALIDTGATSSAVDDRVMQELNIPSVDTMETITPHGEGVSLLYNASVVFTALDGLSLPLEGALGCYLGEAMDWPLSVIMLLGRDLLRHFTLLYDGPNAHMILRT